jgi:DNA-binding transcriptional MocR family regulator
LCLNQKNIKLEFSSLEVSSDTIETNVDEEILKSNANKEIKKSDFLAAKKSLIRELEMSFSSISEEVQSNKLSSYQISLKIDQQLMKNEILL